MRHRLLGPALLLLIVPALPVPAQDEKAPAKAAARYGFDYVPNLYPQGTPKETMASIIKAIDASRVDYLLAQLAEPGYVDRQVAEYKTKFANAKDEARTFLAFDKLVGETVAYYQSDPLLVRDLRRFAREGAWDVNEDVALGSVKDVPTRKVFLRKLGGRWYLENRQQ